MSSRADNLPLPAAMLRGALAGAAGAAAMIAAEHLANRRWLGRDGVASFEWGNRAALVAHRTGRGLGARGRASSGVALHLLYGAALGAAYGAARSRDLSAPAQRVLESLLSYAAFLSETQRPSARGLRRIRPRRRARTGMVPISASDIFGAATARAFQAIARI